MIDLSDSTRLVFPDADAPLPAPRNIVTAEPTSMTGCVDKQQQPTHILQALFGGAMAVTVKDLQGNPVAIDDTNSPEGEDLTDKYDRMVLFLNLFCDCKIYAGRLFRIGSQLYAYPPAEVISRPGIYRMELYWRNGDRDAEGSQEYLTPGLVSVEQTIAQRAIGPDGSSEAGPLSISRIRRRLRDFLTMNDDTGAIEFSIEEIVTAILEPIEHYNEMPPHSQGFTANTFPYRQQWLDATVARLLQSYGMWMMRQSTEVSGKGLQGNDRAKYTNVIGLADKMWTEYRQFVIMDKRRLNIRAGFRIV